MQNWNNLGGKMELENYHTGLWFKAEKDNVSGASVRWYLPLHRTCYLVQFFEANHGEIVKYAHLPSSCKSIKLSWVQTALVTTMDVLGEKLSIDGCCIVTARRQWKSRVFTWLLLIPMDRSRECPVGLHLYHSGHSLGPAVTSWSAFSPHSYVCFSCNF